MTHPEGPQDTKESDSKATHPFFQAEVHRRHLSITYVTCVHLKRVYFILLQVSQLTLFEILTWHKLRVDVLPDITLPIYLDLGLAGAMWTVLPRDALTREEAGDQAGNLPGWRTTSSTARGGMTAEITLEL